MKTLIFYKARWYGFQKPQAGSLTAGVLSGVLEQSFPRMACDCREENMAVTRSQHGVPKPPCRPTPASGSTTSPAPCQGSVVTRQGRSPPAFWPRGSSARVGTVSRENLSRRWLCCAPGVTRVVTCGRGAASHAVCSPPCAHSRRMGL